MEVLSKVVLTSYFTSNYVMCPLTAYSLVERGRHVQNTREYFRCSGERSGFEIMIVPKSSVEFPVYQAWF